MREKLSDIISDYADFLPWETIDAMADSIIENGFTIPVRCKDCKHCEQGRTVFGKEYYECRCEDFLGEKIGVPVYRNDFCSYGERREGE